MGKIITNYLNLNQFIMLPTQKFENAKCLLNLQLHYSWALEWVFSQAFDTSDYNIFSEKHFGIQLIYNFSFENGCLWYKRKKAGFNVFRTTIELNNQMNTKNV